METKRSFYLIDDDRTFLQLMAKLLEDKGHEVTASDSSVDALKEIVQKKPDCVLTDMMMPEMDGLQVIKWLREEPTLKDLKIIMVSGKAYEFDRQRALEFGADGYITKPVAPKQVVDQIVQIIEDRIGLTFWGVHGTLPVPGEKTVRYGGNTSCVSLEFANGSFFIFDAGSGIKALSDHILRSGRPMVGARIFISHPHWDHINALPFFGPLYVPGNEFEIYGPSQGNITLKETLSAQMDGVYFPIKLKEFGATLSFHELAEETIAFGEIKVRTMLLSHPGNCLGYRVDYKDRTICYITDNELYPESSPFHNAYYVEGLSEFIGGADALITDTTYLDEEYPSKIHWGHSSVSRVADLACRGKVKTLYLFHHDPDHTDDTIDQKLELVRSLLKEQCPSVNCIAPREKMHFRI